MSRLIPCLCLFLAGTVIGACLNQYICRIFGKQKIAWGKPCRIAVALANGILFLWTGLAVGTGLTGILCCACAALLLAVGIIDEKTFEIPPVFNLLIGAIGAANLLLHLDHFRDYLMGMGIVSGLFLIAYFLTGGNGIGGGDIKLMAAAGLFLGWQKILLALFIGSVLGMVIHLSLMKFRGRDRVLAFGPYLSAGIFSAMLYGDRILDWYLKTTFVFR